MKKITRRQFLTSVGATSAALLLSSLPHAAAADENCLRKVTPAATNSNDLSWDMAEEILTHISDPVFPAYTVNVLDYGAVPNDGKLDTAAIQRAIDDLSRKGGGTIVFEPGNYVIGTLELRSNIELHLKSGATLLGSTNPYDYIDITKEGADRSDPKKWNYLSLALIEAYQAKNIKLTGEGTIDARGCELALAIDSLHKAGVRPDPNYFDRLNRPRGHAPQPLHHQCL